jgi:hypothetical protein
MEFHNVGHGAKSNSNAVPNSHADTGRGVSE